MKAFVKGHIEATRLIYTDRAKVMPIIVKYTKLPADVVNKALDFMVEKCIWDPNNGLGQKRVNFTAELMTKVGNIPAGQDAEIRGPGRSFVRQRGDQGAWRV